MPAFFRSTRRVLAFARLARAFPALALLGLNTVFTLAVAQAFVRGLDITCACFGAATTGSDSIAWVFARDVLLLVTSVLVYRNLRQRDTASDAP